jgi:hypothetical protein
MGFSYLLLVQDDFTVKNVIITFLLGSKSTVVFNKLTTYYMLADLPDFNQAWPTYILYYRTSFLHCALSNSDFLAARYLLVTLAHTPFTCCLPTCHLYDGEHFVLVSKHFTLCDEVVESACEDVPPMILLGILVLWRIGGVFFSILKFAAMCRDLPFLGRKPAARRFFFFGLMGSYWGFRCWNNSHFTLIAL